LDEFPLPGRLVHEIIEWLYRDSGESGANLAFRGKSIASPEREGTS
jgi:hypothetical protein